jgi:hypothetical protein
MEDARSIPLDVRNFAAARAVVSLPGCRIVMMRSFARILDGAYRMPGGMVILPMTDDLQVNSKGMDLDARFFIALRGSDECHFVERRTNHHAMIIFSPGLSDRGWFDQADDLRAHGANRPALLHARQLLLDILRTASVQPALFETTEVAAHLQEGLLLALDDLFRIDPLSDRSASVQGERSIKLVQRIDDYVAAHQTAPIYTADLAGEFGVSIRTLGGAVSKVCGMSLHQYIRLTNCGRRGLAFSRAAPPPSPHARAPRAFTIWASFPQLTARSSTKRRPTRWHEAGKRVRRQADGPGRCDGRCCQRLFGTYPELARSERS